MKGGVLQMTVAGAGEQLGDIIISGCRRMQLTDAGGCAGGFPLGGGWVGGGWVGDVGG